ncbi:MAG: hypothetical protein HUJ22_01195 [Gracilimonas sp.]|uniref:hypothetical protein n=1 Tax=Gracilimonas sp. TaxID=1974203 RepID=UPI0019BDD90F|nr:hypothetical protein [Gracilimonas sp.]MBD3615157.1 hypothetical protein [Gracilimonas sp.]
MKPFFKNALATLAGIIIGGAVNMGIIMISGAIIPPPEGADVTTMEGLQEAMHLFQPQHFVMPFLAHALGTLVGAFLTAYFVVSEPKKWAFFIGCFFLLGGVSNVVMLPAPLWFSIVDLVGAYIPMAYLGAILTAKIKDKYS